MSFPILPALPPWPEDLDFLLSDELNQNDKGSTSSLLTDEPSALHTSTESKTSSSFAFAHPSHNPPCKRGTKRKNVLTSNQIPKRPMLNNNASSDTEQTELKDNLSSMFSNFKGQLDASNLEAQKLYDTLKYKNLEEEEKFKLTTIDELSNLPKINSTHLSLEELQSSSTKSLKNELMKREILESIKLLRRLSS